MFISPILSALEDWWCFKEKMWANNLNLRGYPKYFKFRRNKNW